MKLEIEINRCRFCDFFVCETDDGMEFLGDDETRCDFHDSLTGDDETCEHFQIHKGVLKELKTDYGSKFVKVIK